MALSSPRMPCAPAPCFSSTITTVHGDFGSTGRGMYFLAVVDQWSRYPEVELVESTASDQPILALEKMFATHGFPIELCSDNGPPFQGQQFARYLDERGIKHWKVTPLWPRANGEADRFMRTLNKVF